MMEDKLKKLPLRSVPNDYAERVMQHIAQVQTRSVRWSNALIAAQITVTGIIALLIAWVQSAEMIPVLDTVIENLSGVLFSLEQFSGDLVIAFDSIRIEPLEGIASLEWTIVGVAAAIVWLLANSLLIVNLRKEKLA